MSKIKALDNVSVIVPCLNEVKYIPAFATRSLINGN